MKPPLHSAPETAVLAAGGVEVITEVKAKGEMDTWFLNNRNGGTNSMPPFQELQLSHGADAGNCA